MFFGMLTEIDIEEHKSKKESTFLSFADLKSDNLHGITDKEFFEKFRDISKIKRKTRLEVSGEWTDRMLTIMESEKMQSLVSRNTLDFGKSKPRNIDNGILISDENVFSVIKIYDQWYSFSTEKKPIEMFKSVMDERLAKFIWYNIRRSIIILKSVTSWRQTENHYKPLKIIKIAEKAR